MTEKSEVKCSYPPLLLGSSFELPAIVRSEHKLTVSIPKNPALRKRYHINSNVMSRYADLLLAPIGDDEEIKETKNKKAKISKAMDLNMTKVFGEITNEQLQHNEKTFLESIDVPAKFAQDDPDNMSSRSVGAVMMNDYLEKVKFSKMNKLETKEEKSDQPKMDKTFRTGSCEGGLQVALADLVSSQEIYQHLW